MLHLEIWNTKLGDAYDETIQQAFPSDSADALKIYRPEFCYVAVGLLMALSFT